MPRSFPAFSSHPAALAGLLMLLVGPLSAWAAPEDGTVTADSYGINSSGAVGDQNETTAYALIGSAGLRWLRGPGCSWNQAEPEEGTWQTAVCDYQMSLALDAGLQPVVSLGYASTWCTTAPRGTSQANLVYYPPCDYQKFYDYVYRVVSRYGPNANGFGPDGKGDTRGYGQNVAHYYEIGNEPNIPGYFHVPAGMADTPANAAAQYAQILYWTHQAVKAADPSAQLLIGGLATGGTGIRAGFFDKLLHDSRYPAAANFDIMNFHSYSDSAGFDASLQGFQASLASVGASSKPIWVTEVGHSANPQYPSVGALEYPATPQGQARYLKDLIPHILSQGVAKVFWFTSVDQPTSAPGPFCTSGLFYYPGHQCNQAGDPPASATLVIKPAYYAYKLIVAGTFGS